MDFVGTRIQVYGTLASGHGTYDVTLDGTTTQASGSASSKKHQQLIYDSGVLEDVAHHIKVALASSTSSKAMQVDFIEVTHGELEVDGIYITTEDIIATKVQQIDVTANISPWVAQSSANIVWTSSDSNVASVDANGQVTILSEVAAECTIQL